ncbi:MAG: transcription antitermination protein NusB [Myxococcales bacterium FL481]|nr:MAG: transcription antitermination protein NusB [Myxococcales bacterium FL481]
MTPTPSTEPKNDRAAARELALLVLCHLESYPAHERAAAVGLVFEHPPRAEASDVGGEELGRLFAQRKLQRRAEASVAHVLEHAESIDAAVADTSRRWSLARMLVTDRNVIRLATAELLYVPDSPRRVVVAEAVRLATRYGSERSGPFVNAVVEQLATRLRPRASTPGASADDVDAG